MNKLLITILCGGIVNNAFATIGDTPYVLSQNLKAMNCANGQIHVAGTANLAGDTSGVAMIFSATATITQCSVMPAAKAVACADLMKGTKQFYIYGNQFIKNIDTVKAMVKSKQILPFEACITTLVGKNMTMTIDSTSGPGRIEMGGTLIGLK